MPLAPSHEVIDAVVIPALREDRAAEDVTTRSTIPKGTQARATLVAKARGRLAGVTVFFRTFQLCDPDVRGEFFKDDGWECAPGDEIGRIEGDAQGILAAERTALNLMQHLSGIATRTAKMVELAAGQVRVLDTRKTLPGLRALEKYAVRCGGGENHRFGLFDEVLIKDNHVDISGRGVGELVERARAVVGSTMRITAEARSADEALAAVRAGVDVVMLDNMAPMAMAELCPRLRRLAREYGRQLEIEASGNVTEKTMPDIVEAHVDRVSIGSITHSAPALDLSLRIESARPEGRTPPGRVEGFH